MSKFITIHGINESHLIGLDNISTVHVYEKGDYWRVQVTLKVEEDKRIQVYKGTSQTGAITCFDQISAALDSKTTPSEEEQPEFRICNTNDPAPRGYVPVHAFYSLDETFTVYRIPS